LVSGGGITRIVSGTTPDERELIGRAQAGERTAFQGLAERHAATLYACALSLCRDRQRAEDLAQETLVEAWRSLGRFDGRCRFSTWLYGILRHRFLKGLRRRTHAALVPLETASSDQLVLGEPTPAVAAERSEDAVRVRQAVAELPEEQRWVIELRFFAGASLEEIAGALGCPLGTVKSRLHHGLEKLRQRDLAMNLFHAERESPERNR
jgi:RNA polymerase sigma-70 factor (ECF subfamily)